MLIDDLPTCRFCSEPAERWRLPGLPRWGEDVQFRFIREEDAYAVWDAHGAPDDAYGTCSGHFESTLDDKGNITLTAAGLHQTKAAIKEHLRKGNMRGAAAARAELKRSRRLEVIERLGGRCETCGEDDTAILRAHWGVRRPIDSRTPTEWYQHLLDHPAALAAVVLRCPQHLAVVPLPDRDAAIKAYGGVCVDCGAADGPLWVTTKAGVPAMKWPNGNKMSSKEKYKRLVAAGFPDGYEVRCAEHAVRRNNRGNDLHMQRPLPPGH